MVDVSEKPVTRRVAPTPRAACCLRAATRRRASAHCPRATRSRWRGSPASRRRSAPRDWIPLAHPLPLDEVAVEFERADGRTSPIASARRRRRRAPAPRWRRSSPAPRRRSRSTTWSRRWSAAPRSPTCGSRRRAAARHFAATGRGAGRDRHRPRPPARRPVAARRAALRPARARRLADARSSRPATSRSAQPGRPPARLFGPEHGYYGVEQDMVAVRRRARPVDRRRRSSRSTATTKRRCARAARRSPGSTCCSIDLQDVGARYYTFAATAVWAAEAALAAGLEVWILDRPNPLGGEVVEGNLPRAGLRVVRRRLPHCRCGTA